MPKVLLVTNDFPPRPGGIQSFLYGLVSRLPAEDVVVYTSRWRGWEEWDATQRFRVVREDTSVLLPTPAVRRRAQSLMDEHGCDVAWFGAAAPLGVLADALRRAGARRVVATTHGHEAGWAQLPAARQLLGRIGESTDTLTYLGEYTRSRIAGALTPQAAGRMVQLPPGVDEKTFHPGSGGDAVRLGRNRPELAGSGRVGAPRARPAGHPAGTGGRIGQYRRAVHDPLARRP